MIIPAILVHLSVPGIAKNFANITPMNRKYMRGEIRRQVKQSNPGMLLYPIKKEASDRSETSSDPARSFQERFP
jgi:hypothetical protein